MIPKKIHYCWFGNKKMSELNIKCINSWKQFCPDFEIIRWDESNYNIKQNYYMYEAYEAGKMGFVPDYARLDIIYNHGGIYLDTDVELIKGLDDIVENYEGFAGFERKGSIALGLGFGAKAHNPVIKKMLKQYDALSFKCPDGSLNLIPSPNYQTQVLSQYKIDLNNIESIQYICDDFTILPKSFLNPIDLDTGKIVINNNTLSIHHYAGSWLTPKNKRNLFLYRFLSRFFSVTIAQKIRASYKTIKKCIK